MRKTEILFDNRSSAIGPLYGRVNFVIESQVTIQGINLDPDDVITFEVYHLTSGTMDEACGCFIKPGDMPEISGVSQLMCPECDFEGEKHPVRLTAENPVVVLDAPQGQVIRAKYEGPGLGFSTVWITNGTTSVNLQPGDQGCPEVCCESDEWIETGQRRCNQETGKVEAQVTNICGELDWIELHSFVWVDTGETRCDGDDIESQQINDCGDIRWVVSGSTSWEDTGETRCSGDFLEKQQVNECGQLRWVVYGDATWVDTGETRCGEEHFERQQINECGQFRWVEDGDLEWTDTGETRCEEGTEERRQINRCGDSRWFDTELPCGFEPGVFLPCGGMAYLPGEGDPEAIVEVRDCDGYLVGMIYPSPRPGANTPVTPICPGQGDHIIGYAVNGGRVSESCDPVIVDTFEDCGVVKAVWSDGSVTDLTELEDCCEDPCSCDGIFGSISVQNTGELTYIFTGSAVISERATEIVEWLWDFGDGNTDTGQTVTHTYASEGAYTVLLTVVDDAGCQQTVSLMVDAEDDTVDCAGALANFEFTFDGLEVSFTDSSTPSFESGQIVSWEWDFGDGTSSTQQNPTHEYSDKRTRQVQLTITDSLGCKSKFLQTVRWPEEDCEDLKAVARIGYSCGLSITFTSNGTTVPGGGVADSYSWDFGDGNSDSGAVVNHTYLSPGTYTATLTVEKDNCVDTASIQVTVPSCRPYCMKPHFTFDADYLDVEFQGSTNHLNLCPPDEWEWDFGDGNTDTGQTPNHTYAEPGTYTVTLTVVDQCGCEETVSRNVTVNEEPPPCDGIKAVIDQQQNGDLEFSFSGANSTPSTGGSIGIYEWSFFDGATLLDTGTGQPITYTWPEYTEDARVELKVIDTAGCEDTTSVEVELTDPCADFQVSNIVGGNYRFLLQSFFVSTIPGATFTWDFGDGNTATGRTVTHTYEEEGQYTVTVTAERDGCQSTATKNIDLRGNCDDVEAAMALENEYLRVDLKGYSKGTDGIYSGSTFLWDFGDGNTSTDRVTSHTYDDPGTYTVSLTVEYRGCVDTTTQQIKVCPRLNGSLVQTNVTFSNPLTREFQVVPFNFNRTYEVDFGGGLEPIGSTGKITHTFPSFGTHPVTLVITDGDCSEERNLIFTILDFTPICEGFSGWVRSIEWVPGSGLIALYANAKPPAGCDQCSARIRYLNPISGWSNWSPPVNLVAGPEGFYEAMVGNEPTGAGWKYEVEISCCNCSVVVGN